MNKQLRIVLWPQHLSCLKGQITSWGLDCGYETPPQHVTLGPMCADIRLCAWIGSLMLI